MNNTKQSLDTLKEYNKGEVDQRPWGFYEVINAGIEQNEEFCEKKIGVKPYQALSLQRHHGRREYWEVLSGELTVIHNGEMITLRENESIEIHLEAPHCMINVTDKPVVVYEKQMGLCRESDNDRLCDFGGRDVMDIDKNDAMALKSKSLYLKVTDFLHEMQNNRKDMAA